MRFFACIFALSVSDANTLLEHSAPRACVVSCIWQKIFPYLSFQARLNLYFNCVTGLVILQKSGSELYGRCCCCCASATTTTTTSKYTSTHKKTPQTIPVHALAYSERKKENLFLCTYLLIIINNNIKGVYGIFFFVTEFKYRKAGIACIEMTISTVTSSSMMLSYHCYA